MMPPLPLCSYRNRLEEELAAAKGRLESQLAELKVKFERLQSALVEQDQQTQGSLSRAELDVHRKYADPLQQVARQLKARSEKLDELIRQFVAARRVCATLHWLREKAARELAAHDAFRFSRYLTALFHDGPAGSTQTHVAADG